MVNYKRENLFRWRNFIRSLLKFLPWQIAFHWEGWPVAPAKPTRMVLVGFGLVYLLVGGSNHLGAGIEKTPHVL